MEKTYYERFGLRENASLEEIKKAYRKLSLKYHPDKHGGDLKYDNIFKQINTIYQILSDPIKRKEYDEILSKKNEPSKDEFKHETYYNNTQRNEYNTTNNSYDRKENTRNKTKENKFKSPTFIRSDFAIDIKWLFRFLLLFFIIFAILILCIDNFTKPALNETTADTSGAFKGAHSQVSYVVNASGLNIRSGPGQNSDVVGKLSAGDIVSVSDMGNPTWWKISYNGTEGYVAPKYLITLDSSEKYKYWKKKPERTNLPDITQAGTPSTMKETQTNKFTKHQIGERYLGGFIFSIYQLGQHGLIAETKDLSNVNWEDAKKECEAEGTGWHLPDKDELDLLYRNKDMVGGLFVSSWYWSSTENNNYNAWLENFANGRQTNYNKYNANGVRAVRAF